jgi:hypothetical protein
MVRDSLSSTPTRPLPLGRQPVRNLGSGAAADGENGNSSCRGVCRSDRTWVRAPDAAVNGADSRGLLWTAPRSWK